MIFGRKSRSEFLGKFRIFYRYDVLCGLEGIKVKVILVVGWFKSRGFEIEWVKEVFDGRDICFIRKGVVLYRIFLI